MTDRERIDAFLEGSTFAVVGASSDRGKYGNKVLRCYLQHGRTVHPVNPGASSVEGLDCYPDLASVPRPLHGVSIIIPNKILGPDHVVVGLSRNHATDHKGSNPSRRAQSRRKEVLPP